MNTSATTYNVIDEPWIQVRLRTGDVTELSLSRVIDDAARIRGLAGEIPTQDVAVLRLLLAVVLGATRPEERRNPDRAAEVCGAWWDDRRLPVADIHAYLARHRDRFDLLHPTQPFLQVAGLTTASGHTSGLGKLIAEIPDGHQFFTTRAGAETTSMSFAEAARWLVNCQAFDPSGIKTGALGDDRVKGGRGYPLGPAWAGNLGLVVAEGDNLLETLLLNAPVGLVTEQPDLPIWECPPVGPAPDALHPLPTSPADLFTWPSRRIRLLHDGRRVTDVQISNGDKLTPQNLHRLEPMSAWRHSAPQSKQAGSDVYMPITHDPSRRVWQGLGALLVEAPGPGGHLRSGSLAWIEKLIAGGDLPATYRVSFRTVGVRCGTQNAFIEDVVDDRLSCRVAAITDPVLVQLVVNAAGAASRAVVALANLASNLAEAAGGEADPPRGPAFEFGYSRLDGPYRRWLAQLGPDTDLLDAPVRWHRTAWEVLVPCGQELVEGAGPAAWVGRYVPRPGGETVRIDTCRADLWFRAALTKALPLPTVYEGSEVVHA